jgi:murein DD-endopeptidase MepM/ murein hydrolase activator NlpD
VPAHTVLKAGLIAATFAAACGAAPTSPSSDSGAETCTGYPAWQTSAYVLPYPVGTAYRVAQGNCSAPGNGHRGTERYSYDWEMSIGTPFSAVRAGTVVHVETSHLDGQVAATGFDNYIVIRHPDGTHALYGHLTHDGASVREGDTVTQGQPLGLSGNTGNTNNFPHLHVSVHGCDPVVNGSAACATQPVTFRNTEANPSGLIVDRRYTALPY